jgi:CRP-like cAMP-binding protein
MNPFPSLPFELLPPVPAVSLVGQLKAIPLFRFASVDELFRVATISRQVRYAAGAAVQERGGKAEYIQVLLTGRFRLEGGDGRFPEFLSPPAMLGSEEVLRGTALQISATAEEESIALVMAAEEFRALLAANIEIAQGLFRILLDSSADPVSFETVARTGAFYEARATSLSNVEKVLYLQGVPIFSHATAGELYEVAAIARETTLADSEILFSSGSPASIYLLLAGALELADSRGGKRLGAGDSLGVYETLAGASFRESARVVASGKALHVEREPLFDLLADRMDLLQGVFTAVFRQNVAAGSG